METAEKPLAWGMNTAYSNLMIPILIMHFQWIGLPKLPTRFPMHSVSKLFITVLLPLYGMGTQFLSLPTTAEELSIGNHPTINGLSLINPALAMAPAQRPRLAMSRGIWLGDVTLSQLGYTQNFRGKTFHLNAKYSGLSDLEFRGDVPQDDAFSSFSTYGIAMNGGVSIRRETQKFGLSCAYVFMGLYTETSSGLALNLGYAKDFKKGLKFGITVHNLGKMTTLAESVPNLPTRILGGFSKEINFNEYRNTLFGSLEWNHLSEAGKFHFGNRFRWNRFDIMGGFSASENVVETSAGFALTFGNYQIKYALRFGSQNLGSPQILTIRFRLP